MQEKESQQRPWLAGRPTFARHFERAENPKLHVPFLTIQPRSSAAQADEGTILNVGVSHPVRVLVVHRLDATRVGVRLALESEGITVCAEAVRLEHAVSAAAKTRPDVCLVDSRILGGGAATVRGLSRRVRGAAVIVLGDPTDDQLFLDVVRAGARGYISESVDPSALAAAVRRAASGVAVVPSELITSLVDAVREGGPVRALVIPGRGRIELSRRQSQVLALACEGRSTAEIAARLAIEPATVRQHLFAVQRRLGASSRTAVLALVGDMRL